MGCLKTGLPVDKNVVKPYRGGEHRYHYYAICVKYLAIDLNLYALNTLPIYLNLSSQFASNTKIEGGVLTS